MTSEVIDVEYTYLPPRSSVNTFNVLALLLDMFLPLFLGTLQVLQRASVEIAQRSSSFIDRDTVFSQTRDQGRAQQRSSNMTSLVSSFVGTWS